MTNNYNKKLEDMWEFCNDAFDTPEDLTTFLEISMEDLIMAFPKTLVKLHSKIFIPLEDEDDNKEKNRENALWNDPGTEEDVWD